MLTKSFARLDMPSEWKAMADLAQNKELETDFESCDKDLFKAYTLKNNLATPVHIGVCDRLPPELHNEQRLIEIRLMSKMQRLQAQSRISALATISAEFEKASIPLLSFKGTLLSTELYGKPDIRSSCDIDILVDQSKLTEAVNCLNSLGYEKQSHIWEKTPKRKATHERRHNQMHYVFRKDGVAVELHWRISYRFEIPFDKLWDGRRSFSLKTQSLNNQEVFTLGENENLCYLITHGAGHGFRQLRWLIEVHMLLKRCNFMLSPLYLTMRERGVASLLLETVLLLYSLPCFEMPEELCITEENKTIIKFKNTGTNTSVSWSREEKSDMTKAIQLVKAVYPLLLRNNPEEGLDGRIYKHLLPTLGHKTVFLFTLFEPDSADFEWIDLPDSLFFLYYILHPVNFLIRRFRNISKNKLLRTIKKNGDKTS